MDSVRFGRALGIGARQAAKALITAADAATSPNPTASSPTAARTPSQATRPQRPTPAARSGEMLGRAGETLSQRAARTTTQLRDTHQGIARGGKRFGEAVWGPFLHLSRALWLELTGVFFGLFLLTALLNAWKLRANLRDTGANHDLHQRLLFSIAMAAVFGYFTISSFVRANRRPRRS